MLIPGSSAAATAWPVPVVSTVTTISAPGSANCAGSGACVTIRWQPEAGATFHYSFVEQQPDGSYVTLDNNVPVPDPVFTRQGLDVNAVYGFHLYAGGGGRPFSAWTQLYPVNPVACAVPQPYGPPAWSVARSTVWDGESWAGWSNANTPGEFYNSMNWTACEPGTLPYAPLGLQGGWLAVNYINAENFTAPLPAGTAIWHLAVP